MILLKVDLLGANGGGVGSVIDTFFIISNITKKHGTFENSQAKV